jgi:4-hydroxyphenylpyruvate dioxygenase
MTHYVRDITKQPEIGRFSGFDHLKFYVSNAKQAASYFTTRYAFRRIAYRGLETGDRKYCTHVVRNGSITLAFISPLEPDEEVINSHIRTHGDAIQDIAFAVDDARGVYAKAVSRGAISVKEPEELMDENGSVTLASVKTFGDTIHTFVQRSDYTGPFLPGYASVLLDDPINSFFPPVVLKVIDHVVGNQPIGEMQPVADWYERMLDFHRFFSADDSIIHTQYSALHNVVMADWDASIKMTINEPAVGRKRSQIQEFVDYFGGPGSQHMAWITEDIISAVTQFRSRGVRFLSVPPSYYANLEKRLVHCPVEIHEDINKLKELEILVDFDDQGYLLQIFTEPVQDRPTLFIEILQRNNCEGFGVGNFRSLFEALEIEQQKRGNLD